MSDWISTVITNPAADNDLTTLAIVKDELNIPTTDSSRDGWLGRAISQVSGVFIDYCNRQFWPEELIETQQIQQDPYPYQTPGGVMPLQLTRWPLIKVASVKQIYPIATTNALVAGTDFSIDYNKGWLQRLNPFTGVAVAWEALPVVIDYVCGYGALPTEAFVIPATPFQITVAQAATFSFDSGVTFTSGGAALTKVTGTPSTGQYAVNTATGVYTFAAADVGLGVNVTYAYANIPVALVDAVLRVVTQRFWGKDRDPMLMSIDQPNLGSKRFWVPQGNSGQSGALPPEIASLLAPYRVPVIA